MDFARGLRTWALIFIAAGLAAMGWVTAALAQTADGDVDATDSDEFSLALLIGVIAVAAVGWFVYRGRSPRSR
jgi:hypothetical protein